MNLKLSNPGELKFKPHKATRNLFRMFALFFFLGVIGASAAYGAGPTCSVNGAGSADYQTIQAAVNDPNCATINVAAGVYRESVTIGRSVTIIGAGDKLTFVDGGFNQTCCTVFTIWTNGNVTLRRLTIRNGSDRVSAGGIVVRGNPNFRISESTLSNNVSYGSGGGSAIGYYGSWSGGKLTVSYSLFSGNKGGYQGGAIYIMGVSGMSSTVLNSTFIGNEASQGGAIYQDYGSVIIENSTFNGNRAGNVGGALFVNGSGVMNIVNSTFGGNQASGGGAIHLETGAINVSSSTIAGNSAGIGGAVYKAFGQVNLKSTIIANNSGGNCGTHSPGNINDLGNTLRWPSHDTSCVGAFGDPKLEPLADNGFPVQTMALQVGSAAIDRGSCTDISGKTVAADQRGTARPLGRTCDAGAFESPYTGTLPPQPIGAANFVAYWKFDDGPNSSIATDSSGRGNTGTVLYADNWIDWPWGLLTFKFPNTGALNLTGSLFQDHVNVGSGVNLAGSSFTVSGWVKRGNTAGKQWVLSQGTQNTDRALVIGFRNDDRFTFAFYNDDLDTPTQQLDVGVWHHWACTFDAATRARRIYRDGVLVASDISKGMFQASGVMNIGRAVWGEAYFTGHLDDLRIYNRALPVSDIQLLAAGNQ